MIRPPEIAALACAMLAAAGMLTTTAARRALERIAHSDP